MTRRTPTRRAKQASGVKLPRPTQYRMRSPIRSPQTSRNNAQYQAK